MQVAGDCLGDVKTQAILPKYHVGFASIDFAFFTLDVSHRHTKTNRCALSGIIAHLNLAMTGVRQAKRIDLLTTVAVASGTASPSRGRVRELNVLGRSVLKS